MKFDGKEETKEITKQQVETFAALHKNHTQTMWKVAELQVALQKATQKADSAYDSFQNFCMDLEKEYDLKGKRWRINEAGKIEIISVPEVH